MTANNNEDFEIQKSLNYASVIADGIILKLESDGARLIFYEKILEPTEDGKSIDTKRKILRLKHEVRISESAVEEFALHAEQLIEVRRKILNVATKAGKAKGIPAAWGRVEEKMQSLLYNTDNYDLNDLPFEGITADIESLLLRVAKEKGIDPDEFYAMLHQKIEAKRNKDVE